MKLLVNAPINALSFGNVSVNILRELHKKNVDLVFFPIGDKAELEAYDKIDPEFIKFAEDNHISPPNLDQESSKHNHLLKTSLSKIY